MRGTLLVGYYIICLPVLVVSVLCWAVMAIVGKLKYGIPFKEWIYETVIHNDLLKYNLRAMGNWVKYGKTYGF
jgi:hypothetical protein